MLLYSPTNSNSYSVYSFEFSGYIVIIHENANSHLFNLNLYFTLFLSQSCPMMLEQSRAGSTGRVSSIKLTSVWGER